MSPRLDSPLRHDRETVNEIPHSRIIKIMLWGRSQSSVCSSVFGAAITNSFPQISAQPTEKWIAHELLQPSAAGKFVTASARSSTG